ncbi:MAG: S8 family serine peptidase [Bacteroidetes bacterium]|nr:S8 family serine peptidase [Bacteroidota bacterium]
MVRFLLLLLTFTSFAAQAQLKVQLKSGTYHITEGTFKQLSNSQPTYGVGLWDRVVLAEDKKALTDLGVELGHYLPKNAFEVKIPAGVTIAQLRDAGLSAFVKWTPRMKLDAPLAIGDWPEWAVLNDGRVAVQFKSTENWSAPSLVSQVVDLDDHWHTAVLKPESLLSLAQDDAVLFIQAIEEPGTPENYNSRAAARLDLLNQDFPYRGSGVVIGIGDDGDIGPHADYKGRLTSLAGTSIGDHGDHVAGTVFGAGNIDPDGEGIAPESEVIYYSYPSNLSSIDTHYSLYGIRVTNSSYSNGCNAGYTAYAAQMDNDALQNQSLIHVFSAGNSGFSNCGYGAGTGWGTITGGHKQGKNVVACGNLLSTDVIALSSSMGPAADGRIKPDLCAIGSSVYSTLPSNTYGFKTGTSMSAPAVAGFFGVLHNAFDSIHLTQADGGLLKAIALNTADDLGNHGPDFKYGYGRINARKAVKVISDSSFISSTITTNDTLTYNTAIPSGVKRAKYLVYWTDAVGSTSAAKALVNDLDFDLEHVSSGLIYKPWVLNPSPSGTSLNNPATRSVDTLNNIEQVTLENPMPGDYKIRIYGSNIPQGPQKFYLIQYNETEHFSIDFPVSGSAITPGPLKVRWQGSNTGISWAYSSDSMVTWSSQSVGAISNSTGNWNVPSTSTSNGFLRLIKGSDTAITGPFTVLRQPQNIQLEWVCPDSIKLSFNPVTDASSYTVYFLGQKFMDEKKTDTNLSMVIPYQIGSTTWAAVSANIDNKHGKRSYAIEVPALTSSCPLDRDAGVSEILNPTLVSSCFGSDVSVIIKISNPSTSTNDTVPVAFEINNIVHRDTLFLTLLPYQETIFKFSSKATINGSIAPYIKVWTELAGDQNASNDTIENSIGYYNANIAQLPFEQNFDSLTNCGTALNCGGTICNIGSKAYNLINGDVDDIDWRIHSGSTPSSGTGPNSGVLNSGKYIYLEASGNCENRKAILATDCIDLSAANWPILEYSTHLFGINTGRLIVEVFNGSMWNIVDSISGNQGNNWLQRSVDLSAYVGDTIIAKFTGITGDGYQSDIAIDEIKIFDNIGIPIPDFTTSTSKPCLNSYTYLNDKSARVPTSWKWTITPNTFTFHNNTSDTSQNPVISFQSYGSYSIQLIASNSYGTDSVLKSSFIDVSPLSTLPLVETWIDPNNELFDVENPDGGITWSTADVIGPSGALSTCKYMRFYNYTTIGEVDYLISEKISTTGFNSPVLIFDVSYAPYANYTDSLGIAISGDCGNSFDTVYLKGGADLATSPTYNSQFVPSGSADWRTDTVYLSNLISNQFQIKFFSINGYGNNLYLDNIRVIDNSGLSSTATVSYPSFICEDEIFNFEMNSTDSTIDGEFTLSRIGSSLISTFLGLGSHQSALTLQGNHVLEYIYYNAYTFVADSAVLVPGPQLDADFKLQNTNGLTYQFTDLTTPTPSAWFWDFGDGNSSTAQNPTHTFSGNGPTTVKLVVTTDCGLDSISVPYNNIGLNEDGTASMVVYPNPTGGILHLQTPEVDGKVFVQIFGMNGALVEESLFNASNGRITLNLGAYASGFYQIKVTTENSVENFKVTKY